MLTPRRVLFAKSATSSASKNRPTTGPSWLLVRIGLEATNIGPSGKAMIPLTVKLCENLVVSELFFILSISPLGVGTTL